MNNEDVRLNVSLRQFSQHETVLDPHYFLLFGQL